MNSQLFGGFPSNSGCIITGDVEPLYAIRESYSVERQIHMRRLRIEVKGKIKRLRVQRKIPMAAGSGY
jgi:hypothetical protein